MTVSEQIIQVINALCEKFGIAINWTGENVIPYLEVLCGKLVAYEIGTSIAWMVIMTVASIGSIFATKKLTPIFKDKIKNQGVYECTWDVFAIFAIIGLVILNCVTICVLVTQTMDIIKCAVFPEMYVFEYISALAK